MGTRTSRGKRSKNGRSNRNRRGAKNKIKFKERIIKLTIIKLIKILLTVKGSVNSIRGKIVTLEGRGDLKDDGRNYGRGKYGGGNLQLRFLFLFLFGLLRFLSNEIANVIFRNNNFRRGIYNDDYIRVLIIIIVKRYISIIRIYYSNF